MEHAGTAAMMDLGVGGGSGGGGGGGPRAMLLTSSLVTTQQPELELDTRRLDRALVSLAEEIHEVRAAVADENYFESRVNSLIQTQLDLQVTPELEKRDQRFEEFRTKDFGAALRRVDRLEAGLLAAQNRIKEERAKVASLQVCRIAALPFVHLPTTLPTVTE